MGVGGQYSRLHNRPFLRFLFFVIVYDLNGEKEKEGIKLSEDSDCALSHCDAASVYIYLPGRDAVRFVCCLSSQVRCPRWRGPRDIYYLHCATRYEYIYLFAFSLLPLQLCV